MKFEVTTYPHFPRLHLSWLLGYGFPGRPSRRAGVCLQVGTRYFRFYWRDFYPACTCHPDDNPPVPCAHRYALIECRRYAASNGSRSRERLHLP